MNNLITFEGIDCSGKSTQIKLLEKKLNDNNISYSTYREPGGNPLSEKIREILLDKSIDISNEAETLLFLAARAELANKNLFSDLKNNKVVICDRFSDSTLAYQGYGKKIDIDIIMRCNKFATNNLEPQLTFILDIDYEITSQRMKGKKDRMEENSSIFFQNVINGYKKLALNDPSRYFIIDGVLTEDIIHNFIWDKINDRCEL